MAAKKKRGGGRLKGTGPETKPISTRVPVTWIEALAKATAVPGESPDYAKHLRSAFRRYLLDRKIITEKEAGE